MLCIVSRLLQREWRADKPSEGREAAGSLVPRGGSSPSFGEDGKNPSHGHSPYADGKNPLSKHSLMGIHCTRIVKIHRTNIHGIRMSHGHSLHEDCKNPRWRAFRQSSSRTGIRAHLRREVRVQSHETSCARCYLIKSIACITALVELHWRGIFHISPAIAGCSAS